MNKDYYDILGVARNASQDDIKRAYRILAHQYHPDKNNGNDKRFKDINEAYRILSGDATKTQYDQAFNGQQTNHSHTNNVDLNQSKEGGSKWIVVAVIVLIFIGYGMFGNKTSNNSVASSSDATVLNKDLATDSFPFNDSSKQYSWYDHHDVAMAYRCYPSSPTTGCSAADWAYAIYKDRNDSRGQKLKEQSDTAFTAYMRQFPTGKCVTESGVKICDLSYSVKKNYSDGTREINFEANAIDCVEMVSGKQSQNQGNTVGISNNDTYCASDLGAVYIDPTLQVTKYFNQILKDNSSSAYYVPSTYGTCIWTYADGNGAIPYILVSSNVGPSSGFDVKAFCKNGNDRVDIYSYMGN